MSAPIDNDRGKLEKKSSALRLRQLRIQAWGSKVISGTLTRASSRTSVKESPPSDHVYELTPPSASAVSTRKLAFTSGQSPPPLKVTPVTSTRTPEAETEKGNPYGLGLFQLHPKLDESRSDVNYPVDIIALHGINGTAYSTWIFENEKARGKEKSKVFWLEDFLPKEFPGARVHTFGYDARIFFSMSRGDIESFARTLLEDIRNIRQKKEEQRRPIIFIAHSMGGLVVKKALIIANDELLRYGNIRDSTSSIFFMATPHRGSDHAHTLAKLAKIVSFPFVFTLINRITGELRDDLIAGLQKDNSGIQKITSDFTALLDGSIKFFTFLEMKRIKPLKHLIVPEDSGRMGLGPDLETYTYLDEDHKSIVRYDSAECPSYKRVLAPLMEAVIDAVTPYSVTISAEDEACLRTLSFPSMMDRQIEAAKAHPSTCAWILSHPTFQGWLSSSHGLLWLRGHPGTGKSTLMAYLYPKIQTLQTRKNVFLHFFFSNRGDSLQKAPLGMYRTLLYQIYKHDARVRDMIYEIYEEKQRKVQGEVEWQAYELQQLFEKVVKAVAMQKEVTILVDALDEATEESGGKAAQELLQFFHELSESLVDNERCVGGIKALISCRHYPVVGSSGTGTAIEVEKENARDIWNFVYETFRTNVLDWNSESIDSQNSLVDAIAKKADWNFLWATLRIPKLIRNLNDGEKTFAGIEAMIANESNELFPLYESILASDVEPSLWARSLLFLQWVCFVERPLSLAEMRYAMASDDRDAFRSCEDSGNFISTDRQMEKLMRSLSGGLVDVKSYENRTTVQFIHETVLEYLYAQGLRQLMLKESDSYASSQESIVGRSHDRLARSCLNYLSMENIGREALEWLDGVDYRPPFLEYAVQSWKFHAEKAEMEGMSQGYIFDIFISISGFWAAWVKMFQKLDNTHPRCPAPISSLIHDATASNLKSIVKILLELKFRVDITDASGFTALHLAADHGHKQITSMLLDAGCEVNLKDFEERTPLDRAVANGHESIARELLSRGADVHDADKYWGNALHAAAGAGALSLIQLLLDSGADINACSGIDETALQRAAEKGQEAAVKLLISRGADVTVCSSGKYGTALHVAADYGNIQICRALLEAGADINAEGGTYGNALQAASQSWRSKSQVNLVKYLLEQGADVNAVGGKFGTALQAASTCPESEQLLKVLLDAGADINIRGGVYGCVFRAAVRSSCESNVRMLMSYGAGQCNECDHPETMLQTALMGHNRSLVEYFLEEGADVNARGGERGTALHIAMQCPEHVVDMLLERGADVNASGSKEYGTVLNEALWVGRDYIIRKLLARGAKPTCTRTHLCALERAARRGKVEILELLISHGANVNCLGGGRRMSALQMATFQGHAQAVELLLDKGADIYFQTQKYGFPLQLAILYSRVSIVQLLLDKGADPNMRDNFSSPLEAAKENKTITRLLLDRGAKQDLTVTG